MHLIDVLRGVDNERIQQFGHDQLSAPSASASDLDARTWRGVFRQLVAAGLLDVDAEGYGGLRLTDTSRAVLRGEQTVMLRKELPRKRGRERERGARTSVVNRAAARPAIVRRAARAAHAAGARAERAGLRDLPRQHPAQHRRTHGRRRSTSWRGSAASAAPSSRATASRCWKRCAPRLPRELYRLSATRSASLWLTAPCRSRRRSRCHRWARWE